ncbi:MAG: class A beta-lactamase-related serine hydrolase [Eubacteriales bacterium]|nr:class A beta-lactamase-related serine hydrolase [Eubacteriales bacterium]
MNDNNKNNPSSQVPDNESGEYEYTPEEIDALNNALKAFEDLERAIGDLPGKPDDSDYVTTAEYNRATFEWLKSSDISNANGDLFEIYIEELYALIRFNMDENRDLFSEFINWLEKDVAAGEFKEPAGRAAKMLGMNYYELGGYQGDLDKANRYIFISKGWYYKAYLFGAITYEQFKEKYPDWEDFENALIDGYFKLNVILGLPKNHATTEFFSLHPHAQRTKEEQKKRPAGKGDGYYIANNASILYKNGFIIAALVILALVCGYFLIKNYSGVNQTNITTSNPVQPDTNKANINVTSNEVDITKIERILANDGQSGRFSVYIKDLKNGAEFYTANVDQPFIAAGSIFPAILFAVGDAVERNFLSYQDKVMIQDYMLVGGTGVLSANDIGKSYSIADLVDLVIMHSDNSAANILIDQMGGIETTNLFFKGAFNDTTLNRYLMDTNAINNGIENYITAREVGFFISSYANVSDDSLDFPKADMTAYIPSICKVYHQVGVLSNVYNEAFVVFGPDSKFVLAIMSQGTNNENAKKVIGKILHSVYYDFEN